MPLSRLAPPLKIYVDASTMPDAGRGVFAAERIPAGTLIEQCPVIALPDARDRDRLRKTGLVNYYFLWGDKRDHAAICLGWGAMYNHSFSPNAMFEKAIDDRRMDFTTLRDIEAGEEILVNYNGTPDNRTPLLIPGIPAEAGGMPNSKTPRIVSGFIRRMRILARMLSGRSASFFLLAAAGAA